MTPEEARAILDDVAAGQQSSGGYELPADYAQQRAALQSKLNNQLSEISIGEQAQQQSRDNMSTPEKVGRHLLAGVATGARGMANLPNAVTFGKIPETAPSDYNYYDALNVKRGIPDALVEGVVEYAPFGRAASIATKGAKAIQEGSRLGKYAPEAVKKAADVSANVLNKAPGSALLKANVLGGAAYGAATAEDPLQGAALGGAFGGVAHGVGQLADRFVVKPILKGISQEASPLMTKAAQNIMAKGKNADESTKEYLAAYQKDDKQNKALWDETDKLARTIDDSMVGLPNAKFNAKPYKSHIDSFIAEKEALEPGMRADYSDAIELAQELKALAPQSFGGVVALRKGLNQRLNDFMRKRNMTSADHNMESLVSDLKTRLGESLPEKVAPWIKPKVEAFRKSWTDANKSHQDLQRFYQAEKGEFNTIDKVKGIEKMMKAGNVNPSVLNKFEGVEGFKHLSELIGPEQAAEALRANIMRETTRDKGLMKQYKSLYPEERELIFGATKEGDLLKTAAAVDEKFGKSIASEAAHLGLAAGGAGLPVTIGMLLSGEPFEKSVSYGVMAGGLGAAGRKGAASKFANSPEKIRSIMKTATDGRQRAGLGTNVIGQPIAQNYVFEKNKDK